MTAKPAVLVPPPVWSHPHVRGWFVWMRWLGYRGPLPGLAVGRCQTTYPQAACPCGLYRVWWGWGEVDDA